jgi:integrase
VFSTEDGRPLSNRNTARDIEAAGKRAPLNEDGLRPVSAHMLSQTFASRLIGLGLDPVEVARQLGDKPDTLPGFTRRRSRTRGEETRWERIADGTRIALYASAARAAAIHQDTNLTRNLGGVSIAGRT